jgi:hypothetical protein
MVFSQVIQLYAPFLGLIALAFWTGVLSQRVKGLEKSTEDFSASHDAIIRMTTVMEGLKEKLDALERNGQNTNRQLANLAAGKDGFFKHEEK